MKNHYKIPGLTRKRALFGLILLAVLIAILPVFEPKDHNVQAYLLDNQKEANLALINGNSLLASIDPAYPNLKVSQKMKVVVTAYSSTPEETDDTPFITASGSWVRNGIVANNWLPFGTKIRMPEIYGDKIFTVEDRMNWKKSNDHVDVWFPSHWEAECFGAKYTYIEVLERVN